MRRPPKIPLTESEYKIVSELLQAAWQILRNNERAEELFRRLVAQLDLPFLPLSMLSMPPHIRERRRNLTDAEIDLALEQLEAARNIYAAAKSGARIRTAEHRLWCALIAARGRMPERDVALEPSPPVYELVAWAPAPESASGAR